MISDEQLAEWEALAEASESPLFHPFRRRPPVTPDADDALLDAARDAVPALIAEVRRLTRERDALREVVEQIAEGDGCYTPSYADCCDMHCQAKARAALAKLNEVKP